MNKRGQFYLIAAFLIILIISGIATIQTYAVASQTPQQLNDLNSNLAEEGPRVVDYGIYSKVDVKNALDNFTSNDFAPYFLKKVDNASMIFIYGNKTNLYGVQYSLASKGTVSANIGGTTSWNMLGPYAQNMQIIPSGSDLNVTLLGKTYNFQLRDNQMFYFIMIQQKNGETYVKENN